MRLLTAAEMRAVDARVIEGIGIPGVILMENAGRQVAEVAATFLQESGGRKVSILVGKGNNGGDGLVAARCLNNLGYKVRVFLLAKATELTGSMINTASVGTWISTCRKLMSRIYLSCDFVYP